VRAPPKAARSVNPVRERRAAALASSSRRNKNRTAAHHTPIKTKFFISQEQWFVIAVTSAEYVQLPPTASGESSLLGPSLVVLGGWDGSSVNILPTAGLATEDVEVGFVFAGDRILTHHRCWDSPFGQLQKIPAIR
jgi:hypothetical protein